MTASIRDNQPQQAEILAKVEEIVKSRARTTQSITLPKPIQILDYSEIVIGKELGAGSYSCAYEIKRIGNGKSKEKPQRQFIMKKLSRKVLAHPLLFAACAADLVQEGRILASVNHPNIIQIRAWSGPDMIDDYFQKKSRDKCYLVMDRLDQNMEQKLQTWKVSKPSIWNLPSTRKQLELDLRKEKITNVLNFARALEHLHQHYILHRDLKPGTSN
jgi:serine/threonine protein kinase